MQEVDATLLLLEKESPPAKRPFLVLLVTAVHDVLRLSTRQLLPS